MRKLIIRRFDNKDATEVSRLICRNFLEVNINDYPKEQMHYLCKIYSSNKVIEIADSGHMYVVCISNNIVGCGTIASFFGRIDEAILLTIFVIPELHGRGIGSKILETLESDEHFLRSKRIEIPSSITACEFYKKIGYVYKNRVKILDSEGHYRLEKLR